MKKKTITFENDDESLYFHVDFNKEKVTISSKTSNTSSKTIEIDFGDIQELTEMIEGDY